MSEKPTNPEPLKGGIMRKLIGLLAILFTVLMASPTAAAEEPPTEDPIYEVECTMLNFTDPALKNEDGSYDTGSPINLELSLVDPESRVAHIVFQAATELDSEVIQEDTITTVTWTPDTPGDWEVGALLYEADGTEIHSTGDCDVSLVVASCQNPDVLTSVNNDDGSVSVYDGEVLCGTVLPEVVTPKPVVPAAPVAELPRTGFSTQTKVLGASLLICVGWSALLVSEALKKRPAKLA